MPSTESDVIAMLELLEGNAPVKELLAYVEVSNRHRTHAEAAELERAKQLAVRIHSRLVHRQRRAAGLAALVDAARELSALDELDAVLRAVTRRARLLLGIDMSYISLVDAGEGAARVRAADGHTSALTVGLRVPTNGGVGNVVLAEAAPIWTPDYLTDERIRRNDVLDEVVRAEGLHAMMAVPLFSGTRPTGVLYAADRTVRQFTADERSLLASLGDLAGAAIDRAHRQERAAGMAGELVEWTCRSEAGLAAAEGLADRQERLIELVRDGRDLDVLAKEVSRMLDSALQIWAPNGTLLARAGDVPDEGHSVVAAAMVAHAAAEPVSLDNGAWVAPIHARGENLGTLLLCPYRSLTDRDERLLRLATNAAAIMLLLGRSAITESQIRDELLAGLLGERDRPARGLPGRGLELDGAHVVVVARPDGEDRSRLAVWASSYAHRRAGVQAIHDGCAVLVLPGTDPGTLAREVHEELSPVLGRQVTVGAAGPVSDEVLPAYREAVRCLEAMAALGATGRWAAAGDLGFVGLLLADTPDVDGFVTATIGPVIDYDRERSTDLARTLEAYFEAGASPTYAAERLYVHPNTVARRLDRISELLGHRWQKPEQALRIQLALRLSRIRHLLGAPLS